MRPHLARFLLSAVVVLILGLAGCSGYVIRIEPAPSEEERKTVLAESDARLATAQAEAAENRAQWTALAEQATLGTTPGPARQPATPRPTATVVPTASP